MNGLIRGYKSLYLGLPDAAKPDAVSTSPVVSAPHISHHRVMDKDVWEDNDDLHDLSSPSNDLQKLQETHMNVPSPSKAPLTSTGRL
jgi:hypothetical protein